MADLFTDYLNFVKHSQADTLQSLRETRLFNDGKASLEILYTRLRQMTVADPDFEEIKKKVTDLSRIFFAAEMQTLGHPQIVMTLNPKTPIGLKNSMKLFQEFGIVGKPYFLYNSSGFAGIVGDISTMYNTKRDYFFEFIAAVKDRQRNVNIEFHSKAVFPHQ